ncbi:MAG: B12-binding domain-containing radical SAM protein [Pseudobdellovibrio sp.]
MRVLLIRPPYVIPMTSVYGNKGTPPLGLVYLAAALEGDGHQVTCIDAFAEAIDSFEPIDNSHLLANGLTIEKIIQRVPPQTELIGLSCMFSNEWIYSSRLIVALKKRFPEIKIVLGGEHVTADSEHILKTYPEVDFCILGEGEEKLKNLVNKLQAGVTDPGQIEGISYLDQSSKQVVATPFSYRIKNINDIKTPAWHKVPLRNFLDRGFGMSMQGKRTIPMLLSRGCPYRCTFCSNENMWTTKWIARDINCVIDEIKDYIREYKIEHIDFYDLTAVVNRNWTLDFCKRLIQEDLKITWALPSGTRSEALDAEVLNYLFKSGCTKITYAPESGSKVMSKKIKKNVNLQNMIYSMKTAVKTGLIVKANMIFGFPEERRRDVLWNFWFLVKMAWVGVHDVPCFAFTPYPGSALFRKLLSEGKITRDENYNLFLAQLVYTSPLDRKSWSEKLPNFMMPILSLGGIAFFYFFQYLFRPQRFVLLVKNVINKKPNTMLEIAFTNMIDDYWHGRRTNAQKPV